jgi:hypothetical protein
MREKLEIEHATGWARARVERVSPAEVYTAARLARRSHHALCHVRKDEAVMAGAMLSE